MVRPFPNEKRSKIFAPNSDTHYPTDPRLIELVSTTTQLIATAALIGLQPIDGPIGIAELLRFNWAKSDDKTMSIEYRSQEVSAVSRSIDSVADMEAIQDFTTFAPNQESFIIRKMAQTIANRIDNEHLHLMSKIASEYTEPLTGDIANEIRALALDIGRNTRRGAGNYVILNTSTLLLIKDSPNFSLDQDPDNTKLLSYVGSIYNNIDVYVKSAECSSTEDILIGYQGQLVDGDTGLVWCPYQLKIGPITVDHATLQPKLRCVYRAAYASDDDSHLYYIKATVQKPG